MQPCARSLTHAARANFTLEKEKTARVAPHWNRPIHLAKHSWDFLKVCGSFSIRDPPPSNFQHNRPGFVNSTLAFVICHTILRAPCSFIEVTGEKWTNRSGHVCRLSSLWKLNSFFPLEKGGGRSGEKTTSAPTATSLLSPAVAVVWNRVTVHTADATRAWTAPWARGVATGGVAEPEGCLAVYGTNVPVRARLGDGYL